MELFLNVQRTQTRRAQAQPQQSGLSGSPQARKSTLKEIWAGHKARNPSRAVLSPLLHSRSKACAQSRVVAAFPLGFQQTPHVGATVF